jgi:uncharacterized protein
MPSTLTYPGVYVEEVPSGVRTITGVSTSVTAFVGSARRGPINEAARLLSFSDLERRFGGLSADSELSYAVRQFFTNGGSEAWVVRLAKNAGAAARVLQNSTSIDVLQLTAQDQGFSGNGIEVRIDYLTANPASTFNLTLNYTSQEAPEENRSEVFQNLSMNSHDARYVEDIVRTSQLVTASRMASAMTANGGTETDAAAALRPAEMPNHSALTGGALTATEVPASGTDTIPSTNHNSFKISLDGDTPGFIKLGDTAAAGTTLAAQLDDIANRIETAVRTLKPAKPAYRDFTATVSGSKQLVLTSGSRGAGSSVVVGAADSNDIAGSLKLLVGATATLPQNVLLQGGTESAYTEVEAYNLFIADRSLRKGIYALESVDLFNILCLPGVSDAGILQDADAYCQERRAFLIVDPPKTTDKPDAAGALATGSSLPKSKNAAVYYPWIKIADPLNGGKLRDTAPSGTLAGLYARTDATRGVWKAPAGTEATLVGAQGVVYTLTDGENGTLNPLGVNCIRNFPVFGTIAWGARTLRGADQMADEWKYIPVRRTALFIEESLYRGTQWVVFEPNDEPLWAQIRLNLGAFMHNLFRQGAFQGKTPREAYFVKCDSETTTQNDINLGVVNILVGFAPLKPAEFVVIKLQQMAGQIQV